MILRYEDLCKLGKEYLCVVICKLYFSILDKILKILTYQLLFYHLNLRSYAVTKTVRFLLAHPVVWYS